MDATVHRRSSALFDEGGLGVQLWVSTELIDFLRPSERRVFTQNWYAARLVYTLPHRKPWVLLGEGTHGRPLTGWKNPMRDGEAMFFNSFGLEIENVQDIEKLAE